MITSITTRRLLHHIRINQTLDGNTLVSISEGWYKYIVPKEVKNINALCFEQSKLTLSAVLFYGTSVSTIPPSCFASCSNIFTINLEACKSLKIIPSAAFKECFNITSITIPDSVEKIFMHAFFKTGLTELKISENSSATTFASLAFAHTKLTEFYIPPKCHKFGGDVLLNTPIRSLTLHPDNKYYVFRDNVLYRSYKNSLVYVPPQVNIGNELIVERKTTFILGNSCRGLKNNLDLVKLPPTLVGIGPSAFEGSNIKKITFEDCVSIISILDMALCTVGELEEVDLSKSKLREVRTKVMMSCNSLRVVHLPPSVRTIWNDAFLFCSNLELIDFGNESELQSIKNDAFRGTGLMSFTFPRFLNETGKNVFIQTSNLRAFYVDPNNTAFCAIDGVLFSKDMTSLVSYPFNKTGRSFTIPENVTTIERGAFCMNSNLYFVNLSNVAILRKQAFALSSIRVVIIESTVIKIESGCFADCKNLTHVWHEGTYSHLPERCFAGSSKIKYLHLPRNLLTFEKNSIEGLKKVHCVSVPDLLALKIKDAGISWKSIKHTKCPDYEYFIEEAKRYSSLGDLEYDEDEA